MNLPKIEQEVLDLLRETFFIFTGAYGYHESNTKEQSEVLRKRFKQAVRRLRLKGYKIHCYRVRQNTIFAYSLISEPKHKETDKRLDSSSFSKTNGRFWSAFAGTVVFVSALLIASIILS